MHFDENKLYRTDDSELLALGTKGTMSQWRFRGVGPEYLKPSRNRVLYSEAFLKPPSGRFAGG